MHGESWQLVFDASASSTWGVLDVLPFAVIAAVPFALWLVHHSSSGRTRALLLAGASIAAISLFGLSLIVHQVDQERGKAARYDGGVASSFRRQPSSVRRRLLP